MNMINLGSYLFEAFEKMKQHIHPPIEFPPKKERSNLY